MGSGAGPSYCDAGCQSAFGTCGTPSTSAAPSHQTVLVGANGLSFTPDTIIASPGSRISFQFSPGHHAVTQSSFSDPCHPLSSSSIFSGFVDDTNQIWTIPVVDTDPIYLYCSAPFHCQIGMVMVINPPATGGTVDAYRSAAGGAGASTYPSQVQGGTFGAFSVSPDGSCGGVNSYTCMGSQRGIQPCCSASGFWYVFRRLTRAHLFHYQIESADALQKWCRSSLLWYWLPKSVQYMRCSAGFILKLLCCTYSGFLVISGVFLQPYGGHQLAI
jgi:plastocyanin